MSSTFWSFLEIYNQTRLFLLPWVERTVIKLQPQRLAGVRKIETKETGSGEITLKTTSPACLLKPLIRVLSGPHSNRVVSLSSISGNCTFVALFLQD